MLTKVNHDNAVENLEPQQLVPAIFNQVRRWLWVCSIGCLRCQEIARAL